MNCQQNLFVFLHHIRKRQKTKVRKKENKKIHIDTKREEREKKKGGGGGRTEMMKIKRKKKNTGIYFRGNGLNLVLNCCRRGWLAFLRVQQMRFRVQSKRIICHREGSARQRSVTFSRCDFWVTNSESEWRWRELLEVLGSGENYRINGETEMGSKGDIIKLLENRFERK